MAWIIITIVAVLLGCFAVAVAVFSETPGDRTLALFGALAVGTIWLIVTFVFSIERIATRQVGIVYSFSGAIAGQRSTGTSWVWPYQHVKTENIGIQREDFVLNQSNSAVSSDQQEIFADLSLNYQIDPEHVLSLYRKVGPSWKTILLDSRVLQDFKEVTSGFTAEQITTKREQLRQQTKSRLTAELKPYDITVIDFFVKNLGYTQSYQNAINAKNQQVQAALQAEAKVAQATAEADQNVALAKGQATATVTRAKAAAAALALKGKALRKNPEVLQLEAIDKLAPNASVIICTAKSCPSFLPSSATVGRGK